MARLLALLVLALVTIAADGGDDETGPPPPPPSHSVPTLEPIVKPPPREAIGRGPAPVYEKPPTATPLPAPSNPGPVTGYGTGGMQQQLGSPPNPSYTLAPFSPVPARP